MTAAIKNIVALRARGIDTVSSRGSLIRRLRRHLPLLGEGNASLDFVTYFSASDPSVGYASLEDGTSTSAPKRR